MIDPTVVQRLMQSGQDISVVCRIVSMCSDEILRSSCEAILTDMSDAPVPFSVIVMGSEGRREQTLLTDQDNAIIIHCSKSEEKEIKDWYLEFGSRLNDSLAEAGYNYCKGEIMARNPMWCVSLETWKSYFSKWVEQPTPKAVMRSEIFFDFRHGFGNRPTTDSLLSHLHNTLPGPTPTKTSPQSEAKSQLFYKLLGQNALQTNLPERWWTPLWMRLHDPIDLKKIMLPVTALARILTQKSPPTLSSTLHRHICAAPHSSIPFTESIRIQNAWKRLMYRRLANQVESILSGEEPTNLVSTKKLTSEDKKELMHDIGVMRDCQAIIERITG
ncbi:MAG: DUF294 nucleotidyltransferase-like domain-containing protein [Balneolales bacterium]|nr:DUF294 nucleotidyltransferase-like domain-containing protein [Balneolales bacterium]